MFLWIHLLRTKVFIDSEIPETLLSDGVIFPPEILIFMHVFSTTSQKSFHKIFSSFFKIFVLFFFFPFVREHQNVTFVKRLKNFAENQKIFGVFSGFLALSPDLFWIFNSIFLPCTDCMKM